jgi:hypothetical protein
LVRRRRTAISTTTNHSPTYAAIGPFAKWTIRAQDDGKTLDLSKVDKIVFEFFVYYRPFEAAAH